MDATKRKTEVINITYTQLTHPGCNFESQGEVHLELKGKRALRLD